MLSDLPRLYVTEAVWKMTLLALAPYAEASVEAGCLWYGFRLNAQTVATLVGVPRQSNRRQNFAIAPDDLAVLSNAVARHGVVCVGQVHTHPGTDVSHSGWDDQQVVSIKILSLVLPNYGRGTLSPHDSGVHRCVDGVWRRMTRSEAEASLSLVPSAVDTR